MYDKSMVLAPEHKLQAGVGCWEIVDGKKANGHAFVVENWPKEPGNMPKDPVLADKAMAECRAKAQASVDWYTRHHAAGRKAHTTCSKDHACDFPRLTEPHRTPDDNLRRVVLAQHHAALVNDLQTRKAVP